MKKKILVIVISMIISGCTRTGAIYHGYTFNDVENIENKMSKIKNLNKKEVLNLFGSPSFIEKHDKQSTFFYVEDVFKRKAAIGDIKLYSKIFRVDFDNNDIVKTFKFYKVDSKNVFDKDSQTKVEGNTMNYFTLMKKNLSTISKD